MKIVSTYILYFWHYTQSISDLGFFPIHPLKSNTIGLGKCITSEWPF